MNKEQKEKFDNIIFNNNFTEDKKKYIKSGLEEGLDVKWYARPEFDFAEMVDVSLYASPEFNFMQMGQIRMGLEKGIDVSIYANPNIDCEEMETIRLKLESKK